MVAVLGLTFIPVPTFACGGEKNMGTNMGKVTTTTASSVAKIDANTSLVTFTVNGMTCGSCEDKVREALKSQTGVKEVVEVSHKNGTAVVKYDPAEADPAKLASVVTKTGFKAEVTQAVSKEMPNEKAETETTKM